MTVRQFNCLLIFCSIQLFFTLLQSIYQSFLSSPYKQWLKFSDPLTALFKFCDSSPDVVLIRILYLISSKSERLQRQTVLMERITTDTKKIALTIFTTKLICGALRDLVPFAQFKKREKHPWRSVKASLQHFMN